MIYTLTLNPSLDYKIYLEDFKQGGLNIFSNSRFFAGGKGINVSIVLKNLGLNSVALGFLGGFTGEYIKNVLDLNKIKNDFIFLKSFTRINLKLMVRNKETEINGNFPMLGKDDFINIINKLNKLIDKDDVLIMSGSIPSSLGAMAYNEIINLLKVEVDLIIDTSKSALKQIIKAKPFLIKPNIYEISELFNTKINSLDEIVGFAKKILENGTENIIVSMGSDGALFLNKENIYRARVPKFDSKSTVGAGDSIVAGFVYSLENKSSIKDAFHFGIASGTATAKKGELCNLKDVKNVISSVSIEEL